MIRRRRLDDVLRRRAIGECAPDPASLTSANDLLNQIPDERRGAFVLTQLLGLSYEETAAVEGVAIGTIRSRVARARAQLVDLLATAAAS